MGLDVYSDRTCLVQIVSWLDRQRGWVEQAESLQHHIPAIYNGPSRRKLLATMRAWLGQIARSGVNQTEFGFRSREENIDFPASGANNEYHRERGH